MNTPKVYKISKNELKFINLKHKKQTTINKKNPNCLQSAISMTLRFLS